MKGWFISLKLKWETYRHNIRAYRSWKYQIWCASAMALTQQLQNVDAADVTKRTTHKWEQVPVHRCLFCAFCVGFTVLHIKFNLLTCMRSVECGLDSKCVALCNHARPYRTWLHIRYWVWLIPAVVLDKMLHIERRHGKTNRNPHKWFWALPSPSVCLLCYAFASRKTYPWVAELECAAKRSKYLWLGCKVNACRWPPHRPAAKPNRIRSCAS